MLEKLYKIPKPDGDQILKAWHLLRKGFPIAWLEISRRANEAYLSWDEFRNKSWATTDAEDIWALIKNTRHLGSVATPILDKDGNHYKFTPALFVEIQHKVDLEFGGRLLGIKNFEEADKNQFIRQNLIEESIASSQLEGANTSRETARRLLSEARKPRDKSERMIVNNHAAMTWIEKTGKDEKLSLKMLLELHRLVTEGTMANEKQEGKLRETFNADGKRLVIKQFDENTITYTTPDKEFVEQQLAKLFLFANDEDGSPFIHPLIKGILLHFWIGLLHPFEDGNGRLARILFYWYMLKKGYWAFSYLSLSERILKSPKPYAMAYIYTEQDDYDLNYFVHYNIEKLTAARVQFDAFLKTRIADNQQRGKILASGQNFNNRQVRLLQYLNFENASHTSLNEYRNRNMDVSKLTAINDLKFLVTKEYLRKQKNGRNIFYLPTEKLKTLLE